jgi:thiamine-phosphate pyrophosphorylase
VLPTAEWVGRMARAGVPTVQLRFKSGDQAAIRAEVKAAVEAVKGTNARLFINDHWQAALDAGAYGIHVGQEDLDAIGQRIWPPSAARAHAWASPPMATPRWCAPMPCSPAISPWAPYSHHAQEDGDRPQGVARLQAYVRLMQQYPLVAIGGISGPVPAVRATGVGSVAVVRALVNAPDPEAAAGIWLRSWLLPA